MKVVVIFITVILCLPAKGNLSSFYNIQLDCNGLDDPFISKIINFECMKQIKIVCELPQLLVKLVDASSKLPSGTLYGSNVDFGNHPECIAINYEQNGTKILGKYCGMAVVIPNIFKKVSSNESQLHGAQHISQHIEDMHRQAALQGDIFADVPILNVTILSICVPDACTPREYLKATIAMDVPEIFTGSPCETIETDSKLDVADWIYVSSMLAILALIGLSTALDLCWGPRPAPNGALLAFSLRANGRKLFQAGPGRRGGIECLDGLRVISVAWIIMGHNTAAWSHLPIINVPDGNRWTRSLHSQYVFSGAIAVDTFFFISGLLLSYGYLRAAGGRGAPQQLRSLPAMYVHRYVRLTPPAAALFFFTVTVFRRLGSGPLWPSTLEYVVDPCQKYWWSYFLYVQNYVNYDNICWIQTWYLSADMQMFILSPILLVPMACLIKRHHGAVMGALIGVAAIVTIVPIAIQFAIGEPSPNHYETHTRLADYVVGMILGAHLRTKKSSDFAFSQTSNMLVWIVVGTVAIAFNIYYHDVIVHPDFTKETFFYILYRPLWSVCLAWTVYSCHHGYGGFINSILTLPIVKIGAKLSYCMFIVHGFVITLWVSNVRTVQFFNDFTMYYSWCGHFLTTIVVAIVWTLMFESPMLSIERYLFGSRNVLKKTATTECNGNNLQSIQTGTHAVPNN